MIGRAFRSQLAVCSLAVLAAVLAEAFVGRGPRRAPVGDWLLGIACNVGLWSLPAALLAGLLAWLLVVTCGAESAHATLRRLWSLPVARRLLLLGIWGAALLFGWVFWVARAARVLHNVELASALVAFLTLLAALLLAVVAFAAWRALSPWRLASSAFGWRSVLALAMPLTFLAPILRDCGDGLAQLESSVWAAPVVLLAGLAVLDRSEAVRARGLRVAGGVGLIGLLAWGMFVVDAGRAGSALTARGLWSRGLIAALQSVSDFDGDGYSSFLGGGDCAPFDPAIGPGAAEIHGDGLDNNCVGGDAGRAAQLQRPIWGQSASGPPRNLNVVIVTIETLRRDYASFISSRHDTTPNLRALANESLVFERMYSAAPFTRLALASLFSSYAPSEIDWLPQDRSKHMRRIGPSTPWLPEMLRARGYETIAVLTDFSAFTSQESAGFERGFEHYDISTKLEYRGGTMWGFPAAQQVERALGYVQRAGRPFLLWLHLFEPHYRYEQPPDAPVFGSDDQSRYAAEIWHADRQVGRLISGLREQAVWDSTILLVTGDHGEAFGEHQDRWHGSNLHDPQLRPASLLRVPGVAGRRIALSTTFTDIAPTLARLLEDRRSFDQLRGRNLAPLTLHPTLLDASAGFVAETFSVESGQAYQAALIAYPLKLIYVEEGRRFALFDLKADPNEQQPLDPSADPRGAGPLRQLVGYLERARMRGAAHPR